MQLSRAAVFAAKIAGLIGAAAIALAVPISFNTTVSAGDDTPPPPPTTTTTTTNGHSWSG